MTGSYDLSFYLAGVFIGISGVVLLILPIYSRTRKYNEMRKQPAIDPTPNGVVKQNGTLGV
jgi:hypothetical protein